MPLDFADLLRRRLVETRQSKHRAAVDGGLPQDAIRSVLNGHSPRLERLEQICDALGLELYVGPPRDTEPSDFDTGKIQIRAGKQTRACARLTDEGQPVEVRQREGVTDHLHPESCAGRCEAAGEALTGARTGRATEHRKVACLECRDRARG